MAKHSSVSEGFRPLAGCGLFLHYLKRTVSRQRSFRPLAGCGLFLGQRGQGLRLIVSVPLRGVGCFANRMLYVIGEWFPSPCGVWVVSPDRLLHAQAGGFRPLAGCGLFPSAQESMDIKKVSVPLRGVGCFAGKGADRVGKRVSVPLRGVGCFTSFCGPLWL